MIKPDYELVHEITETYCRKTGLTFEEIAPLVYTSINTTLLRGESETREQLIENTNISMARVLKSLRIDFKAQEDKGEING